MATAAARWMTLLGTYALVVACGTPSTRPNGASGGSPGTGGSAPSSGGSTGGFTATGGTTITGGTAETGGTTITGGTAETGGTTTTGGTTAAGGSTTTTETTGTGGTAATGGAGGAGGSAFWAGTYDPNCTPAKVGDRDESQGHHRPGADCLTSGCHLNPVAAFHMPETDCTTCHPDGSPDGSGAPAFLFGGTVYQAGTTGMTKVGVAKVEVGVKSGSTLAVACSAANGTFWALAGPSIDWSAATARMRDSARELPMHIVPAAGCNASTCHVGDFPLNAP